MEQQNSQDNQLPEVVNTNTSSEGEQVFIAQDAISDTDLNEILQNNNCAPFPTTPYIEELNPTSNIEESTVLDTLDSTTSQENSEDSNIIEATFDSSNISDTFNLENTENITEATTNFETSVSDLTDEVTSRFSGAEWFEAVENLNITIVGAGGIGSWTSILISRLGINSLRIYDPDTVDRSNVGGQFYGPIDVGGTKVSKITTRILSMCDYLSVYSYRQSITSTSAVTPYVICGLDSMTARREAFAAWEKVACRSYKNTSFFIDGRLSLDTLQIFCIANNDEYYKKKYKEEYLFSDEEADSTVCSRKQTSFMASMIGSLITNMVVNYAANRTNPAIPYDMPFFLEYNSQTMIFKTSY